MNQIFISQRAQYTNYSLHEKFVCA